MSPTFRRLPSAGFVLAALFAFASPTHAHDAWVDARGAGYTVFYGHTDHPDPYAPAKVRAVAARDANGDALAVKRQDGKDAVTFTTASRPALVTLDFDNGVWTRTAGDEPAKNLPKAEVPGAVSATHNLKFGKTVFAWGAAAAKPQGQRLELVPLGAEAPKAGGTLTVQVLWDGRPLAGAKVVRAEFSKQGPIVADADGKATVPIAKGRQMLVVNQRREVAGNPQVDIESVAANLIFTAR